MNSSVAPAAALDNESRSLQSIANVNHGPVNINTYFGPHTPKAITSQSPQAAQVPVLILVTATTIETRALIDILLGRNPPVEERDGISYLDFGLHGRWHVIQTRCEMGGPSAQKRTAQAIAHWKPVAVIAVGIAFGMDEKKQAIGDVLVSNQLADYEPGRVNPDGSSTWRGNKSPGSDSLINRLQQLDTLAGGTLQPWPKVRFGLMLSGYKLVDNLEFREKLKAAFPEAIGGEMEGTGLCASALDAKIDWLVVKAICDWGHDKNQADKDAWQKLAAENAARVAQALLGSRSLHQSTLPIHEKDV